MPASRELHGSLELAIRCGRRCILRAQTSDRQERHVIYLTGVQRASWQSSEQLCRVRKDQVFLFVFLLCPIPISFITPWALFAFPNPHLLIRPDRSARSGRVKRCVLNYSISAKRPEEKPADGRNGVCKIDRPGERIICGFFQCSAEEEPEVVIRGSTQRASIQRTTSEVSQKRILPWDLSRKLRIGCGCQEFLEFTGG